MVNIKKEIKMNENYLEHHGILGQKWGVRRFQNEDGTVTPAGARRYYSGYDRHGRSVLTDENGKKISRKEIRKTIKDIKSNKKEIFENGSAANEYKHLVKNLKRAKRATRVGYIGNDISMALMVNSTYNTAMNNKENAKKAVNDFIARYNNRRIDAVEKMVDKKVQEHVDNYINELKDRKI